MRCNHDSIYEVRISYCWYETLIRCANSHRVDRAKVLLYTLICTVDQADTNSSRDQHTHALKGGQGATTERKCVLFYNYQKIMLGSETQTIKYGTPLSEREVNETDFDALSVSPLRWTFDWSGRRGERCIRRGSFVFIIFLLVIGFVHKSYHVEPHRAIPSHPRPFPTRRLKLQT